MEEISQATPQIHQLTFGDGFISDDSLSELGFLVRAQMMRRIERIQQSRVLQVFVLRKELFAHVLRAFQVLEDAGELGDTAVLLEDEGGCLTKPVAPAFDLI